MFKCPMCNAKEGLRIVARICVELTQEPDGNFQTEEVRHAGHDWDDESVMFCTQCGETGTVADFTFPDEG